MMGRRALRIIVAAAVSLPVATSVGGMGEKGVPIGGDADSVGVEQAITKAPTRSTKPRLMGRYSQRR